MMNLRAIILLIKLAAFPLFLLLTIIKLAMLQEESRKIEPPFEA